MLQAGMIIGGWDKYEGGQIFSVPLGGTILRQPFAIGGIFSHRVTLVPFLQVGV
jgi:20S proteasome alpha/beta subunit